MKWILIGILGTMRYCVGCIIRLQNRGKKDHFISESDIDCMSCGVTLPESLKCYQCGKQYIIKE
jgi:hypothetical protein